MIIFHPNTYRSQKQSVVLDVITGIYVIKYTQWEGYVTFNNTNLKYVDGWNFWSWHGHSIVRDKCFLRRQ